MYWVFSAAYFAIILGYVYFRVPRPADASDYLVANREADWIGVGASLFTLIGAGEFVLLTALGFQFGWSAIFLVVGYSLAFLFLAFFAGRIRKHAEVNDYLSLPDYFHHKFGWMSGLILFMCSVLAFFALLMLQFSAVGAVIAPILDWPRYAVILITGLVVILYLTRGGLRAVLATDKIQAVAMIILLPLLLFVISQNTSQDIGDFFTLAGSEGILPFAASAGLVVTGFLVASASADVWQRMYAAKSDREAKHGFVAGAIAFILIGLVAVAFGILARGLGIEDPNSAFVEMLTGNTTVVVIGAASVLMLSALMSTADTEIFLLTGLIQRELPRAFGSRAAITDLRSLQILTAIVAVTAIAFAFFFSDLVAIYTWLLGAILIISIAVTGSVLFRSTKKITVLFSMGAGAVGMFIGAWAGVITVDNMYLAALPALIAFALTSLFER